MTLKELKENVAASPNKEWLQNYELLINYSHIPFTTTLKGVVNIYDFINTQVDGYSTIPDLPEELNKIKVRFINSKANMLKLISLNNINKNTWDDNLRDISGSNPSQPIFL